MKRAIVYFVVFGVGAYFGKLLEATHIEMTCKSEVPVITVNGAPYVCLTWERAVLEKRRLEGQE